mmetsp:Transcript_78058/g.220706  ORF Transcript_78058/g.220706 Transcript_78058/m.220706 type:complete len:203 (+) Transcript_78058:1833-2441(+)
MHQRIPLTGQDGGVHEVPVRSHLRRRCGQLAPVGQDHGAPASVPVAFEIHRRLPRLIHRGRGVDPILLGSLEHTVQQDRDAAQVGILRSDLSPLLLRLVGGGQLLLLLPGQVVVELEGLEQRARLLPPGDDGSPGSGKEGEAWDLHDASRQHQFEKHLLLHSNEARIPFRAAALHEVVAHQRRQDLRRPDGRMVLEVVDNLR